jgi:NitT/TauT family transport system permease protein
MVVVADAGETGMQTGGRYPRSAFEQANVTAVEAGKVEAEGRRANPVFLPAPHEVAVGFRKAFTTPPQLKDDQWFHQSILHSLRVIFWGFFWSCLFGIPLGLLCGTFSLFARLSEPIIDAIRYMPAPAFGALMVAILGIADGPKIAIIFIGTFFQMVLVIANTTRRIDGAMLEAAQTLGASRRQLVRNVILPGVLPNLYDDLRILLGWAWTYLIVAELIGAKSGISAYIAQQSRYFNFDLVFAAILVIGLLGLASDQALQFIGRFIFPWQRKPVGPVSLAVWKGLTFVPRLAYQLSRSAIASARRASPDEAYVASS